MPAIEWSELRRQLVATFDEDTVQQVIVELLETEARGVPVLDPLHWCRMRAKSRRQNRNRDERVEREAKEELAALGIPLDNRSVTEMARERKRRERRKRHEQTQVRRKVYRQAA